MDVVFPHCAGLDVHKKRITACRVSPDPTGQHADGVMDVQDFGTLTIELLALSDWLSKRDRCTAIPRVETRDFYPL